jgi:hypothetical protein
MKEIKADCGGCGVCRMCDERERSDNEEARRDHADMISDQPSAFFSAPPVEKLVETQEEHEFEQQALADAYDYRQNKRHWDKKYE